MIPKRNNCDSFIFHRHPDRLVLFFQEDHYVFVDFFDMFSMRCIGSNNPFEHLNSPVIHQRSSDSKIYVVVLLVHVPPNCNKANQTKSCGKKMR